MLDLNQGCLVFGERPEPHRWDSGLELKRYRGRPSRCGQRWRSRLFDDPWKPALPQIIDKAYKGYRSQIRKLQEVDPDGNLDHRGSVERRETVK